MQLRNLKIKTNRQKTQYIKSGWKQTFLSSCFENNKDEENMYNTRI